MKYYCIFAVNKQNKNDILGSVEDSFSFSWSKDKVNLWCGIKSDRKYWNISCKDHFKERTKMNYAKNAEYFQYGYNSYERINIKGKKTMMKKKISDPDYSFYHACGRTLNEYEWHWVNHYAKKNIKCPNGYEILVCRANSKHCPVIIDTSVREGMDKNAIEYNKYEYRNAKFKLKI